MIRLEKEGGLWIVTLNRPDKANALTPAMLARLADIAESATEARALILTGEGHVFSAGADLDAARAGMTLSPDWERLSNALAALPALKVAALNGTLAGGGMGMALACDLRIAVPEALFFYPVMRLGFLPQPSDCRRLVGLIGPARARLILMAGARLDADEALAIGLIDRIVPAQDLMATARELVADVLAAEPDIARGIARLCS